MILSDVLTCTVPPLRVESSLLKNPIPPKLSLRAELCDSIHPSCVLHAVKLNQRTLV
jgi:hypothetical protein